MAQGISPDGKLMVTLARKEGVDWDPMKDLTARAYFLLAEQFDLPPMKIYLEKTSPVGAGLGGGSADAAFALRTIAGLGGLALSDEELSALAARLGSDCAVSHSHFMVMISSGERSWSLSTSTCPHTGWK